MSPSVPPTASLLSHFEELEDPRTGYLIEHRMVDMVALTICAVVCGAETWVDIEAYGQSKVDWLSTFLALPHGIPSHDTISRLFAQLDPDQLQDCFLSWIQTVTQLSAGTVVAVYGKTLRHSYDRGQGKGAIHMVSAWAAENRLVLGQVKVDEKSNEITAIPELLKVLGLNGCIVTLDAMGTQKTIAKQIIDQSADYILSLKGNQAGLYEDVQQVFAWARQQNFKDIPHEAYQTIDKGHGRLEIRRHWLLDSVEHLVDADQWVGLKRVGLIESERCLPGQPPTITQRYYLVSLDGGVERFAQATRSHWGIENGLHWCLDVAFHEDDSRIRSGYAPQNMAVIRHIALNLLSRESSAKVGKKAKRLKAGWDNTYLTKVLAAAG
jgi:predicted transposase YbfD/YdcC